MFLNLLNSPQDKSIHEAVVLTYSRLDYFPDSIAILTKAHAEKIIDDDKYYGDLAHLAPVAPREAQALILDRILKSKNAYAFDIVASYAASDSEFFGNGHSKLIGEVLRVGEPRFASDPSAVGAIELIKYATWIKATARTNQFNTGQPANWFVENELLKNGQDPRKILAFVTEMQERDIKSLKESASPVLGKLRTVIDIEHNRFPRNEFYADAAAKLK